MIESTTLTHIILKTPENKFEYKISNLQNLPHLAGTLLDLNFVNTKFDNPEPIEVCYSDEVVRCLNPIIRQGKLIVPEVILIDELADLIQYLAGDNTLWIKFAELLKSEIVMDIFCNKFNMKSERVHGIIFDAENAYLYKAFNENNYNAVKKELYDSLEKFKMDNIEKKK